MLCPANMLGATPAIRLILTGARYVECGSLLPPSAERACPGVLLASPWDRQSPDWRFCRCSRRGTISAAADARQTCLALSTPSTSRVGAPFLCRRLRSGRLSRLLRPGALCRESGRICPAAAVFGIQGVGASSSSSAKRMGSDKKDRPAPLTARRLSRRPLARQPARTAKLSSASIDSPSPRAEAC
jgi:hypothetical protein